MANRGKIVKRKIKELGVKINTIAKALDYNDTYFYRLLDQPKLKWEIIKKIGIVLDYNFSNDFPDMPYKIKAGLVKENIENEITDLEKMKLKYSELLEKYVSLLEKVKIEKAR